MIKKEIVDKIKEVLALPECNVNLFFVFGNDDAKVVKQVLMSKDAKLQVFELAKSALSDFASKQSVAPDEAFDNITSANSHSKGSFVYDRKEDLSFFKYIKVVDEYHPIDYWSKENGKTFEFKDAQFTDIDSIIYSIGTRLNHITYFRKNYVLNTFAPKQHIKYLYCSNDTLDVAPDQVLRLDSKIDIITFNDVYIVNNLAMIQKDGKYEELIKKDSDRVLDTIKAWGIIEGFDKLEESAKDIAVAMKLSNIKHESPIINTVKKDKILDFIKKRPALKKALEFKDDKVSLKTKKAQNYFLHIISDDYVKSMLDDSNVYVVDNKKPAKEAKRK